MKLCGVCLTHNVLSVSLCGVPPSCSSHCLGHKLLSTCLLPCRESVMTKSLQCMQTTQARLCPLPGLAPEDFDARRAVI